MADLAYTDRKPVHTQLAADAVAAEFDLHGMLDADGNTYYAFDKFQTEANLHNALSGRFIEAGIRSYVDIKIGRNRYNKGNRYARVTVPVQNIDIDDLVSERILTKFGISVKAFVTGEGVVLSNIRDRHSATTLFKAFSGHGVRAIAETAVNFSLFIPTREPRRLLAAQEVR